MKYEIKRVKNTDDFSAEKSRIANDNWNYKYDPKPYFSLAFVENKGFLLKIGCNEKDPTRVFTKNGDDVWLDSCLEWFANFDPEHSDIYLNIEMNANGISHFGVGKEREGRKQITEFGGEYPKIRSVIGENGWENTLVLPISTIEKVYGKLSFEKGKVIKANFFKCGDETPVEHYLSWNPITTDEPDFHRPEFFGDLIIG